MTENEVSRIIVDAAIEVHLELGGPGLLEDVYEEALEEELRLPGILVERQLPVRILYKGRILQKPLRLKARLGSHLRFLQSLRHDLHEFPSELPALRALAARLPA